MMVRVKLDCLSELVESCKYSFSLKHRQGTGSPSYNVVLGLTQPQKLALGVRVAPHLYIFYLGLISNRCGTWVFLNTPNPCGF